jgi:hypothetical protein
VTVLWFPGRSPGVPRSIQARPAGIALGIGGIGKCDQAAIIGILEAWNTW